MPRGRGELTTEHVNDAMDSEVSDSRARAKIDEVRRAFPVSESLRFVKNDTYVADPTAILGRVYYETQGSDRLEPFHTGIPVEISQKSLLSAPLTVAELIIDGKLGASADVMGLVSLDVTATEVLELRVIDNATARAVTQGEAWELALSRWLSSPLNASLISSPRFTTVSVVTGVVQKYLTSKKYRKFEAGAKGGGWGVNVEGSLYTSSSDFVLDVVYGIDLVTLVHRERVEEIADAMLSGRPVMTTAPAVIANKFAVMAASRHSFL